MADLEEVAEVVRRTVIRAAIEDILRFDDDLLFRAYCRQRYLELTPAETPQPKEPDDEQAHERGA